MKYNGISVIVPIYNTRIKSLINFIKHLKYQTLDPSLFEVIFVFDGYYKYIEYVPFSELKCEYVGKMTDNQGTFMARKLGRTLATKDIIFEADSDDFIPNKGLERVYNAFNNNDIDLLGFTSFDEVTGEIEPSPATYKECWNWNKYIKPVAFVYNQVVNKYLIDNLPNIDHFIYSEDIVEMVYELKSSNKYMAIPEHFYVYKDGGVSNSKHPSEFYASQMSICRNVIKDKVPKDCLDNFDKVYRKLIGANNV